MLITQAFVDADYDCHICGDGDVWGFYFEDKKHLAVLRCRSHPWSQDVYHSMAGGILFYWLFNHMAGPSFLLLYLIPKPVDRHQAGRICELSIWSIAVESWEKVFVSS